MTAHVSTNATGRAQRTPAFRRTNSYAPLNE